MKMHALAWGAVLLAASPVWAQQESDWRFSLQSSYEYGSISGYVQTPSGGEPGTTSLKRPKLDEIGINNASVYNAEIRAAKDDDEFYVGGQWIHMSGSATLDDTLISQAETFPAGTHVNSEVDLDWYRFGYRHRYALGNKDEWTICPSAGGTVLDAHYRLSGGGSIADRDHVKVNAQLGVETEWRPRGGPFSVAMELLWCPPVFSLPEMDVEQIVAKYRILHSEKHDLEVFMGVGFEQIYYEDNQTVSNKINADLGPMFIVGLTFRF